MRARFKGLKKHSGAHRITNSLYALKVQTSDNLSAQTPAPKVPAESSYDKSRKDT